MLNSIEMIMNMVTLMRDRKITKDFIHENDIKQVESFKRTVISLKILQDFKSKLT